MTVAGVRGSEGALAAVLPCGARELWTDDVALGASLSHGYTVDAARPDVVVLTGPAGLRDAPPAEAVVLLLDGVQRAIAGGGRAADAVARLAAHARVRRQVRQAQRRLQELGHRRVCVLPWDTEVPLGRRDAGSAPRPLHRPASYPRRAVVAAGPRVPSLLDALLEELRATPRPLARPTVTQGGTALLATDRGLLRIGVGRGRRQVEAPAAVLELLGGGRLPPAAASRVPVLLGSGRLGGASWSLEQEMRGAGVRPPLSAALREDCVDFLVALHRVPHAAPLGSTGGLDDAVALAGQLTGRPADVHRLAQDARERLEGLPRGFAHRDFWHRNLLVADGRLSAVVDWDSAGGGALPYLDLMQLVTTSALRPGGHQWGRALVQTLLPWAERGGDRYAERYAAALGVERSPELLRSLVTVFWLDWVGYQVDRYAERRSDPRWVRGNVAAVLDALVVSGSPR